MTEPEPSALVPLLPGVRTATRLGLGIVAGVGGQLARALDGGDDDDAPTAAVTDTPDSRLTAAAVGLVFEAQDFAAAGAERVGAIAAPFVGIGRWALAAPLLEPARRWAEGTVDRLAERGVREQEAAAVLTTDLVDSATGTVIASARLSETASTALDQLLPAILPGLLEAALPQVLDQLAADPAALEPLVDGVVSGVLDSVLEEAIPLAIDGLSARPELLTGLIAGIIDPILDTALPVVMEKLEEDPDVVRDLVLGQSTGMAGDMANQVRSRTVSADDLVERIARKVTFRKPRAIPVPALATSTTGELLHPEGSHALGPPALEAPAEPERNAP